MNYAKELQELLTILVQQGASDLHLCPDRYPYIRVSGELIPLTNRTILKAADTEGLLRELTSEENMKLIMANQEIDFSYAFKDGIRLRGNAYVQTGSTVGAKAIALRLIEHVRSISELRLPPILETFTQKHQGFFLVVGPVGQGKSTTMAAMIDLINQHRREHIVTIENPIEYIFEEKNSLIGQREVGIDTENFESALKSVFRQDINVIMIGEMRSPETISTAVTAAETGHLVLSTLHTNNAAQTVDRIIDAFPPEQQTQIRAQLAASLLGIFSQRLLPSLKGGRVPAYELLINNTAVSNLIREGRTHELQSTIETGYEHGMIDMNRSLAELVRTGEITIETARTYSINPRGLDQLI